VFQNGKLSLEFGGGLDRFLLGAHHEARGNFLKRERKKRRA
jgi:hypothetical protein